MILMIFKLLLLLYCIHLSKGRFVILDKSLECNDIIELLDVHNDLRNKVASGQTKLAKAKDIWVLKWDPELAAGAQEWANNCINKPNFNRPKGSGENIFMMYSKTKAPIPLTEVIMSQINDEISLFEEDAAVIKVREGTEHFTQMIWGETKNVGCGCTRFQDKNSGLYYTLIVCNYRPPGNFVNKDIYELLEDVKCKEGFVSKKYEALCAHDEIHTVHDAPCSGFYVRPAGMFISVCLLLWLLSI